MWLPPSQHCREIDRNYRLSIIWFYLRRMAASTHDKEAETSMKNEFYPLKSKSWQLLQQTTLIASICHSFGQALNNKHIYIYVSETRKCNNVFLFLSIYWLIDWGNKDFPSRLTTISIDAKCLKLNYSLCDFNWIPQRFLSPCLEVWLRKSCLQTDRDDIVTSPRPPVL